MRRCHLLRCLGLMLVLGWAAAAAAVEEGVSMPDQGVVLRITFGLKDTAAARWDGKLTLSQGEVRQLDTPVAQSGKAAGNAWELRTRPGSKAKPQSVHDPKNPKFVRPVLLATLAAPGAAQVAISTPQGDFAFKLDELPLGSARKFLEGQVEVEATPLAVRLTDDPNDDDWPAAAKAADGRVWVAYTSYRHAQPVDFQQAHRTRDFEPLRARGNGDQVRLLSLAQGRWGKPLDVTEAGQDVWRPSVAVDGRGRVWVVWSQKLSSKKLSSKTLEDNWDLYARAYDPAAGQWTAVQRLTDAPGADVNPVAVASPKDGRVWVVWQGWREGSFDILLTELADGTPATEKRLSTSPANEWWPAAAFDSQGRLQVAFDTYQRGNYDVELVSDATGQARTIDVAASPLFEARPSIAVDAQDRVWVAYEQAGAEWGKDSGMVWRGASGEQTYFRCEVVLRVVEGGRVQQAVGEIPCPPIERNYPDAKTRRLSLPRLAIDGAGRVWTLFRRHPLLSGGGEVWTSWATRHTGQGWTEPLELSRTQNLLDNRPAVVPQADGLLIVHSTDGRTNNTTSAQQNDLYATRIRTAEAPQPPAVAAVVVPTDLPPVVHPQEPEDIRRLHDYRIQIGDKTYHALRGEFHRHTELTAHRDQDGTLEDMWRYALDVAAMDWLGNGDHDNGYGIEYLWWMVQKQTDYLHHPPRFLPMFTYERSVSYPSGHRNAMFATRGILPLPRIAGKGDKADLFGTEEQGSPDVQNFYAYLKHFSGICASHTSGTSMGTDWRDNDPAVEPVVEIYQGLRQSYEHEGAPATASGPHDAIGGYRPAGFVWNALQKGYRLGFQSSSDHYSTHISYGIVWADETSRQGIVDAFQRRHSYAANDNIILDVRCGQQMMGDIFTLKGKPTLRITALGTAPIARVSIIRGVGRDAPVYLYDGQPNQQKVELEWTDQEPVWDQVNYYYVRIEQQRPAEGFGALAWASPMWIEVKK